MSWRHGWRVIWQGWGFDRTRPTSLINERVDVSLIYDQIIFSINAIDNRDREHAQEMPVLCA
jgi:hypothetical protein